MKFSVICVILFFTRVANNDNVWYATNIEVYDYVAAYKSLIYSASGDVIYNPTATDVWVRSDGKETETNIHKPCLAQHALFICEKTNDYSWLKDSFSDIERYIGFYMNKCRHESGLYYWIDDCAISVDNDPCTFYRPKCSSGSIYLNCLMFKELEAVAVISEKLGLAEKTDFYKNKAEELKLAIREHCWDERDGFYYSVDFNLLPIDPNSWLHSGCPRHWSLLIQRIGVWSGFLAMWAGIATKEQAERMVNEHYFNEKTFNAPYGVRTLSKLEKMYLITKSGNPSDCQFAKGARIGIA